ncbi:MAG: hypothetical protein GXX96_02800 [Planctomycetaceae bacterium]|nr:hypothetical protein [Planctomycetaceae bacterium]
MASDDPATQPKAWYGCLILLGAAALLAALLVFAISLKIKYDQAEWERRQQDRREEQIAYVRSGTTNVGISDGTLVEMLLDDSTCRGTVTSIDFIMADLGDPRFRRVREFPNVTRIFFYDCSSADNVMVAVRSMPRIEWLGFEVTGISDESMRSLAELPCLKEVRFEQVMPDAKIETLKQLLPNVKIEACLESEETESRRKASQ